MKERGFPHWLTVILISCIGFLISFWIIKIDTAIIKIDTALADISTRVARIEGKLGIMP